MAIQVGDAIFNFLGDTTQLDQAWQKAETDASAKAPAVQSQINGIGTAWEQTGQQAQGAAQQATQSAEQMAAAAQTAGAASMEAAQVASPEWLALAKATDAATRATIEHDAAQKELEAAIAKAAQATEGDQAALNALAAAEQKVATTAAALAAAQKETEIASQAATASIRAEAEAAMQSEIALKEAAGAALTFGQDSKIGAEQAAFSMQEAKGSIALVGEEIGVTVPRHVRGFIAELPGVGAALEAAFSGIALLVLIQLLVEGAEKLTEFVSETFIYTDAMKEEYAQQVKLNDALAEQKKKLDDLKEAYKYIGLSGSAKTVQEVLDLNDAWIKNEEAIRSAKNVLAQYQDQQKNAPGFGGIFVTEAEAEKAQRDLELALAVQKVYQQKFANLTKQGNEELLSEQIQHNEASINAQKTVSEARIELARAESTLRLTLAKAGYSSLIEAQQDFDNQMYQAKLKALQDTLANEAKDPTRNQDRIKELNAQIEALEAEHQAKLVEIRTKGVQALQAALKVALSQTTSTPVTDIIPLPSDVNVRVQQITDILQQFGIKSGQIWQKEVDDAQQAFDKLKSSGVATYAELLQVREKLAQAKLGHAIDSGDLHAAQEYRDELESIRKEMVALGLETDKASDSTEKLTRAQRQALQVEQEWTNFWKKENHTLSQTFKQLGDVGKQAFFDMANAFGTAAEQAELYGASFGEAMRKATAAELAHISATATVMAIESLAYGFWLLAHWDFAGAANAFTSAAIWGTVAAAAGFAAHAINPKDNQQTAAPETQAAGGITQGETAIASQPTQQQNIPRFATGALVTGPTLAIFGEAMGAGSSLQAALSGPGQTEAAIPLDDDRATSRIAQSLARHIPPAQVKVEVNGLAIRALLKEINHEVIHNDGQLHASNSYRLTKKA